MYRWIVLLALSLGLLAGTAFPHGDAEHIAGTVAAIENDHVTLKTPDGKTVTFMVLPTTKYFREKAVVTKADLTVGTRVVVDAKMDKKMKMYSASEVRLGVTAQTAKPAASKSAASTGVRKENK